MPNKFKILGLFLVTPIAAASENSVYFKTFSFSHSEPIAINSLINNWDTTYYKNGDKALSLNQIELGFKHKQWDVSILHRQDYLLSFSPDTADFIYRIENKLPLNEEKTYNLKLKANNFAASGLKLAYQQQLSRFSWQASLSYLQAHELTDGHLQGYATNSGDNDYDFNFNIDYYYDRDVFFDRQIEQSVLGHGYALDLIIESQLSDSWHARLETKDLLAQIYWQDTPRTQAIGSSATKRYDDDGYVIFDPVASGLESNKDHIQTLSTKASVEATYQLNENQSWLFHYNHYAIKNFYGLSHQYRQGKSLYQIGYDLSAKAWKLAYQSDLIQLGLISDKLDWQKARTFGINLNMSYRF